MANVSSVFKTQKFQFKIKTNLSTEARINFGKLPETTAKVTGKTISLKIYTFQDTSRQSTLKKVTQAC